jgi:hypothetical protein
MGGAPKYEGKQTGNCKTSLSNVRSARNCPNNFGSCLCLIEIFQQFYRVYPKIPSRFYATTSCGDP